MKHDALIPKWLPLTAAAGTLALGACVTINIYFPAAAAEKAADRIIEEVYQMKGGEAARPPGAPAPAAPAEKK
jgi:hypothetical protein